MTFSRVVCFLDIFVSRTSNQIGEFQLKKRLFIFCLMQMRKSWTSEVDFRMQHLVICVQMQFVWNGCRLMYKKNNISDIALVSNKHSSRFSGWMLNFIFVDNNSHVTPSLRSGSYVRETTSLYVCIMQNDTISLVMNIFDKIHVKECVSLIKFPLMKRINLKQKLILIAQNKSHLRWCN